MLASADSNSAIDVCKARVQGKRLVTTVAPDAKRRSLEQFVTKIFQLLQPSGVMVLSKPFAAAMANGHDRIRVLDLGLSCLTCTYLSNGVVEAYTASRSLSLRKGVSEIKALEMCNPERTQALLRMCKLILEPEDVSRGGYGPLQRIVRSFPRESKNTPTLLTGDACETVGVHKAFEAYLSQEGIMRKRRGKAVHHTTANSDSDDGTTKGVEEKKGDEDESFHVVEASHSRPELMHFTGASIVASQCPADIEKLLITQQEFSTRGAELIHWRCPGLVEEDLKVGVVPQKK